MGDVVDKTISTTTTNVTLTSASEATVLTSDRSVVPFAGNAIAAVKGWAQVAQSTGLTTLTMTLYRGTSTAGTVIGEANAIVVIGTTTNNVELTNVAAENLVGIDAPRYTMTVAQNSTAGTGTVLNAALEVEIIN